MNFQIKKEIKIALTAIAAIILLFFGLNFLKGINVMKTGNLFYFAFDDVTGLTVANSVYAKGYPVGTIRSIEFDHQKTQKVIVGVEINDEIKLPHGCYGELNQSMLGEASMTIIFTNNTKYITVGDTMPGQMHDGAMNQLSKMIPTFQKLLPKLDTIINNINKITRDTALQITLNNTAVISKNLTKTTSTLNKLLEGNIPVITNNLASISTHVNEVSKQLAHHNIERTLNRTDSLINELNNFSSILNSKIKSRNNTLGLLFNDRSLYDNLNNTLISTDSLLKDLKGHPKRYVHFSIFGRKEKK